MKQHSHPYSRPNGWRGVASRATLLVAAVTTFASLATAAPAHAQTVPVSGMCPDVATLNANAANEPLDVSNDISNNGGSLFRTATAIGATQYYSNNNFGSGVDIALIDSGVMPVKGLDNGNVVQGPDFSVESQAPYALTPSGADHNYNNPDLLHNDGYGHGTHLAGAMVGRDDTDTTNQPVAFVNGQWMLNGHRPYGWNDPAKFTGIAPGSRVVSLKVADEDGGTDVTQVIAAVDWAVKHAHSAGLNIRVINLSYGIPNGSYDDPTLDALSYAVDQAWKAGIVVVAAAGNGGKANISTDPGLNSPGFNRDIITVGAYDNTTYPPSVPAFSSSTSTTNKRMPDLATPGTHVLSLHVAGSSSDDEIVADCAESLNPPPNDPDYPNGPTDWNSPLRGADRFVKASGTSTSAAVASAAVALIVSRNPELTPDQIKALLRQTAQPNIANGSRNITGEGALSLGTFLSKVSVAGSVQLQKNNAVTGGDGLDIARGYDYPWDGATVMKAAFAGACDPAYIFYAYYCTVQPAPGSQLSGDKDIFGQPINLSDLRAAESVNATTHALANGTGPWVTGGDGIETYNGSALRIGAKSVDAFGNPTWGSVVWLRPLFDGKSATQLDFSGKAVAFSGTGSLTQRGWRDSGLQQRSWRDFGLQQRSWRDFGLQQRSWKDHGWRDSAWA